MPTIVLEMERLRNPYSGLGQYCLQLGHAFALEKSAATIGFTCLVPAACMGEFGKSMSYKAVKPWHKIIGPRFDTEISGWHCMHQDSEYLPRSRKTPVFLTIHDLNFLEREDYSDAKKSRHLARVQQKINRVKGLVYISEYVQNLVRHHLKVPNGVLEQVIYNGGSIQTTSKSEKLQSLEYDRPFLFSIGIHLKKNYHVLMPILAKFKEYKWIIAGPDSRGYRARIEQEAARFGVSDRVEFCGPVGEAEKIEYYRQCSALLFPSLSEGFGLPVIEAMSVGKPVFLSKRTSLPEIGGTEAYYFNDFEPNTLTEAFANGMKQFENNPGKAKQLESWAARFTWEKSASQYLEFYQKALTVHR